MTTFSSHSLPEDAENHYGSSEGDERNAVSNGVANLDRPEEVILQEM